MENLKNLEEKLRVETSPHFRGETERGVAGGNVGNVVNVGDVGDVGQ
jgi:hypothetical protein